MARVYVSSVINARNDRVWARVRDFNGLPNWHPAIAESRIEGGSLSRMPGLIREARDMQGIRKDTAPKKPSEGGGSGGGGGGGSSGQS